MLKNLKVIFFSPLLADINQILSSTKVTTALFYFFIAWLTLRVAYGTHGVFIRDSLSVIAQPFNIGKISLLSYVVDFSTAVLVDNFFIALLLWLIVGRSRQIAIRKFFLITLYISTFYLFCLSTKIILIHPINSLKFYNVFWYGLAADATKLIITILNGYVFFLFNVMLYRLVALNKVFVFFLSIGSIAIAAKLSNVLDAWLK